VIVYVGECQSCSMSAFEPRKLRSSRPAQIVVLSSSPSAQLPSAMTSARGVYVVGLPVAAEMIAALDPEVAPWTYMLDSNSRLMWVGDSPMDLPEGVTYEQ